MRRQYIHNYLQQLESLDKKGQLTRDDQIDLWFKQMVFKLSKDIEDDSKQPIAEEDYGIETIATPATPNLFNAPTGGRGFGYAGFDIRPLTPDNEWPTRVLETITSEAYQQNLTLGVYDGRNLVVLDNWVENNQNWITIQYDQG